MKYKYTDLDLSGLNYKETEVLSFYINYLKEKQYIFYRLLQKGEFQIRKEVQGKPYQEYYIFGFETTILFCDYL